MTDEYRDLTSVLTLSENVHQLPLGDATLTDRQEQMLDILTDAMRDVRAGRVEALAMVRVLDDGRHSTHWAGNGNASMLQLVGAAYALASALAEARVESPDHDRSTP